MVPNKDASQKEKRRIYLGFAFITLLILFFVELATFDYDPSLGLFMGVMIVLYGFSFTPVAYYAFRDHKESEEAELFHRRGRNFVFLSSALNITGFIVLAGIFGFTEMVRWHLIGVQTVVVGAYYLRAWLFSKIP